MTNISLLEMARTKKRGVREATIEILSREFPLSVKKIYNKVKKEYNLSVTYQAVFKTIKEMLSENIIKEENKEYLINIIWINELENELNRVKQKYVGEEKEDIMQDRVNNFVAELGPKIKEHIGRDEACIVGVSGGGKFFAIALWKYLLREGLKVNYNEFNWLNQDKKRFNINKEEVENKKLILVDSEIYSGETYKVVMEKLNKQKKKLKIKDIKFVADKDMKGLADFCVSRS